MKLKHGKIGIWDGDGKIVSELATAATKYGITITRRVSEDAPELDCKMFEVQGEETRVDSWLADSGYELWELLPADENVDLPHTGTVHKYPKHEHATVAA